MEREISFVSTSNVSLGDFFSFLPCLLWGRNAIKNALREISSSERDTGLIYTFFFLSLSFIFQRHRWHQYGHPAPGHMVSGVVYRAASSPILLDGVDFDGYVCEWCDEWNFLFFFSSFFPSFPPRYYIRESIRNFFGDWSEIGGFFSPFFSLFLIHIPTIVIILVTR